MSRCLFRVDLTGHLALTLNGVVRESRPFRLPPGSIAQLHHAMAMLELSVGSLYETAGDARARELASYLDQERRIGMHLASILFELETVGPAGSPRGNTRYRLEDATEIDGAKIDGAKIDGATIDGAKADGAEFDGATIGGATIDGATIDGATIDGATIDGAAIDGVTADGDRVPRGNLLFQEVARHLATTHRSGFFRLLLCFESPELSSLPWELLVFPGATEIRLATDARFSLVRVVQAPVGARRLMRGRATTHVLATLADPSRLRNEAADLGVSFDRSAAAMYQGLGALMAQRAAELSTCRIEQLSAALRSSTGYSVLHLLGHGPALGGASQAAELLQSFGVWIPDPHAPAADPVFLSPEALQQLFGAETTPLLVVLLACYAAGNPEIEAHARVERTLTQAFLDAGCPAVLGTRGQILIEGTEVFSRAFYRRLGDLASLDEALQTARREMYDHGQRDRDRVPPDHWFRPVLFVRDALDLELFDGASATLRVTEAGDELRVTLELDGEPVASSRLAMPADGDVAPGVPPRTASAPGAPARTSGTPGVPARTSSTSSTQALPDDTPGAVGLPASISSPLTAWLTSNRRRGVTSSLRLEIPPALQGLPWESWILPAPVPVDEAAEAYEAAPGWDAEALHGWSGGLPATESHPVQELPDLHVCRTGQHTAATPAPSPSRLRLLVIGLTGGEAGYVAVQTSLEAMRRQVELQRGDAPIQIDVWVVSDAGMLEQRLETTPADRGQGAFPADGGHETTPADRGHETTPADRWQGAHLVLGETPCIAPERLGPLLSGIPLVTLGGSSPTLAFADALVRSGVSRAIAQRGPCDALFGQLWGQLSRGRRLDEALTTVRRLGGDHAGSSHPLSVIGTRVLPFLDDAQGGLEALEEPPSPPMFEPGALIAMGDHWSVALVRPAALGEGNSARDWLQSGSSLGTHPSAPYFERQHELERALNMLAASSLVIQAPPGAGKRMLAAHLVDRLRVRKGAGAPTARSPVWAVHSGRIDGPLLAGLLEAGLDGAGLDGVGLDEAGLDEAELDEAELDSAGLNEPGFADDPGEGAGTQSRAGVRTAGRLEALVRTWCTRRAFLILDGFEENLRVGDGGWEIAGHVPMDALHRLAAPEARSRVILLSRVPISSRTAPGGRFAQLCLEPLTPPTLVRLMRQLPRVGEYLRRQDDRWSSSSGFPGRTPSSSGFPDRAPSSVSAGELAARTGGLPGGLAMLEHVLAGHVLAGAFSPVGWRLPLAGFRPPTTSLEALRQGLEAVESMLVETLSSLLEPLSRSDREWLSTAADALEDWRSHAPWSRFLPLPAPLAERLDRCGLAFAAGTSPGHQGLFRLVALAAGRPALKQALGAGIRQHPGTGTGTGTEPDALQ